MKIFVTEFWAVSKVQRLFIRSLTCEAESIEELRTKMELAPPTLPGLMAVLPDAMQPAGIRPEILCITREVGPRYSIEYDDHGKAMAITCAKCQRTSHNTGDIEHLYCGHCKEFHDIPNG